MTENFFALKSTFEVLTGGWDMDLYYKRNVNFDSPLFTPYPVRYDGFIFGKRSVLAKSTVCWYVHTILQDATRDAGTCTSTYLPFNTAVALCRVKTG
jgi:hypothetical protein